MKLLLDDGRPRSAAEILRTRGIDEVHVAGVELISAEDATVLQSATRGGMVVVTLDADFHALLALTGAAEPSVVRIRIDRLRARDIAALLEQIVAHFDEEIERGAAVTVQPGRVRVRRLPLV